MLTEGIAVNQMTMPLMDAQFVEQAKLTRTDVALLFGLPIYMLAGDSGDSLTYRNSDTASLDFVKWSLRPWLVRIEKAVSNDADLMPASWFAEFLVDALLRASVKERYESYALALDPDKGWMTRDEVRAAENLDPTSDAGIG